MADSDRKPRRWTLAEDQTLREHVEVQRAEGGGRDWCRIASELPGRTNKDCRKRWHNSVAEGLRKGQWSKSEDQLLIKGMHRYGSQWTKVATSVSSRSADQCAKRWQQSLDPRLDRSEWREEEDLALLTAVNRLGRCWKDVQQQYLPHRSKNCVKNRYSVLSRRTATQLTPYDDNLGSSSSDPGTPLQMEVETLPSAPMPAMHTDQQTPYMQSIVLETSQELRWPWPAVDNRNVSTTASHLELLPTHTWPVQYNVNDNFARPTSHNDWHNMPVPMFPRYSIQYPDVSRPLTQDYTTCLPQQPHTPLTLSQTYPLTQSLSSNPPPLRSPTSPAHEAWPGYPCRDVAPFG